MILIMARSDRWSVSWSYSSSHKEFVVIATVIKNVVVVVMVIKNMVAIAMVIKNVVP